jgi:hypothetical protein
MNSDEPLSTQRRQLLFPREQLRAPKVFWQTNRLSAAVFFTVNFLFGTLGLWLPSVNAFFLGQSVGGELSRQLAAGGLYIYAITFLAAIGGATFTSLAKDKVEYSRNLKVLLVGAAVVALFLCTIFLQIQLLAKAAPEEVATSTKWAAYLLQLILALLTSAVAIYMHSIVSNEESGSPKEDMDDGAEAMLRKAKATDPAASGGWKS